MEIEKAKKRLGYTDLWIDCGIITQKQLLNQYSEILTSNDDNAEHYRHRAFLQYIENIENFTNNQIEIFLLLEDNGPDECDLRRNRILSILWSNKLSDKQFERIGKLPDINEKGIRKIYNRFKTIRLIDSIGLTQETFNAVMKSSDSFVHEYILSHRDIEHYHLNWLKDHGVTKKIRNIAKQILQSKKFKQKT